MDRNREHEEPFGFDGRSLEEQLAALDVANTGNQTPQDSAATSGWYANGNQQHEYGGPRGTTGPEEPTQTEKPGDVDEPGGTLRSQDAAGSHDGAQTGIWTAWPYGQFSSGWPPESPASWHARDPEHETGQPSWTPDRPQSRAGDSARELQRPAEPAWGQEQYAPEHYGDPGAAWQAGFSEQGYDHASAPGQEADPYGTAGSPALSGGPPSDPQVREPQTADSLSPETLLRGRRRAPSRGWRRAVYRVSGGLIHPGESPAELRRRQLVARGRTVVSGGHHRVAVLSLKGGVGKTTTTIGLGSTLAALRGDRVVAIDANPDRGTLSDKLRLETAATVRDLLNERDSVRRYADVRAFTSQAPSRLEVLASDRDPAVSEAFSEDDYRAVSQVLEHFYSICITDCGTGLLHSAMSGVLRLANQIVLVSSPSVDGARSASATLDWLEAHGFGELVRNATVALSGVYDGSKSSVDLTRLERHFASRCNAVVRIPHDPHLEEGAEVELDDLKPPTRDAYLTLAATVGDGLGSRRGASVSSPATDVRGSGPA